MDGCGLPGGRRAAAPAPMVMGGETEYAISATNIDGVVEDQGLLLVWFMQHVKASLGHTSTSDRGRFLTNGGLVYLDGGLHIEWATPEVTSPFEAVRYLAAGDRIVADLAASFAAENPHFAEVFVSRTNVDYVSGTLWASHESYSHRADGAALLQYLTPFLVSRVLWGAGGWDYRTPGLRFSLSPRAHFITVPADRDSQYVRPIFHTKDESLSGAGEHRLHVACSESLCSQTSNILRFGTTALLVALIEKGGAPGRDMTLAAPVAAIQRFAADPTLRARARLVAGRSVTALELQRHYLEAVEANLGALRFPWAEEVCVLWRRTLDALDSDASHCGAMLDWAIKRQIFERCLGRHGFTWDRIRAWDMALGRLRRTWYTRVEGESLFSLKRALAPDPILKQQMERLTPTLDRLGLSWDGLPALLAARHEVFELDAKFGALGETGLFNALDRAGVLHHQVRVLDVAAAVRQPPGDTRARIRGEVVERLTREGTRYGAGWTGVYDKDRRRQLNLTNPLETEERWVDEEPHPGFLRLDLL